MRESPPARNEKLKNLREILRADSNDPAAISKMPSEKKMSASE
jgi:hypothetical protein